MSVKKACVWIRNMANQCWKITQTLHVQSGDKNTNSSYTDTYIIIAWVDQMHPMGKGYFLGGFTPTENF